MKKLNLIMKCMKSLIFMNYKIITTSLLLIRFLVRQMIQKSDVVAEDKKTEQTKPQFASSLGKLFHLRSKCEGKGAKIMNLENRHPDAKISAPDKFDENDRKRARLHFSGIVTQLPDDVTEWSVVLIR